MLITIQERCFVSSYSKLNNKIFDSECYEYPETGNLDGDERHVM